MHILRVAAGALLIAAGLSGYSDSPFFRLKQTTSNGRLQVTGTNISSTSIVAYVVVLKRAHQRAVWHGVYNGGDALGAGKIVTVGDLPASSQSEQANVTVDYVRLADGTTWGDAGTDEAKEIAARFQR